MVVYITLHINRAERSGRAEVLASTAADTFVFIHGRHLHRAIRAFVVYHLDGSRRAVAGAVAAADTIGQHHTVFLDPYGVTGMLHGLLFQRDRLDGTGRTDLTAPRTFGPTVAAFKRHDGLHEVHQVG